MKFSINELETILEAFGKLRDIPGYEQISIIDSDLRREFIPILDLGDKIDNYLTKIKNKR